MFPLQTPKQPWEIVEIDFVTGLPRTKKGNDAILVVVDHFTKMAHAVPCSKSISAQETANLFIQHIFRLHGLPAAIVSDRGPQFVSRFWHTLFTCLGTKLQLTTAYHPQSNGLTERVNGVLMQSLRIFTAQQPHHWDQHLALVEFAYNNATQTATQQSPFSLNYGWEPTVPLTLITAQELEPLLQENPSATRNFAKLKERLQQANSAVELAKERMASRYNRTAKRNPFKVGDQVLLSTKSLKLKGYDFPKLYPLFVGPFLVQEVGHNTVKLSVPGATSSYFLIKRLKLYHHGGRFQQHNVLPPPHFQEGDTNIRLSLEKVLKERFTGPKKSIKQYLVSFQGYGPENNSWMTEEHLVDLFGSTFKKLLSNFRKRKQLH